MALLAPADQERLRDAFAELPHDVRLLFLTQTIGCESCLHTRQFLDVLPPLSPRIAVEEVNIVLEPDRARQFGFDRAPAIAVLGADGSQEPHDSRIRFLGAPSGYEFMSLVQAVLLVGGRDSGLTPESRARLAAVDKPLTLQVFTTPT
jgi:alkyl hydroperoxide reductase subunit AhpF